MDLEAQFGLMPFTGRHVMDLGVTYRQWRRIKPELTKLRTGVYVVRWAADDTTRHAQKVAAELLTKTDHWAYGGSALPLLNLPNPYFTSWDTRDVEIAAAQTRSGRGIVGSRLPTVPTEWGDCTDLVATATTIAAHLPLPNALMVTDRIAARLAGTDDRFELASEQCRLEVRRRLTRYSDAPALRLANPAAEAPSESFYRGHMILRGYDDPACGVPLRGRSGSQYFADLLIERLIIEIDGELKYRYIRAVYEEKLREDDLRAARHEFLRVPVESAYDQPDRAMDELGAKVDEMRWRDRWTG